LRSFLSRAFPSPAYVLAMGAQAVLLIVALRFSDDRHLRRYALAGVALLALLVWVAALRRRRAILDTPVSRIATAAQGYVELRGTGLPLEGLPLLAPLSGSPCLWYRYKLEERVGNRWQHKESDVSTSCFVISDGTGQCVVDPEGAEVLTIHYRCWEEDNQRCHEWKLQHQETVNVLGDFVTLRQSDALNDAEDISALLADWKKDKPALLRRFDLDGDGQIDLKEWEWARRAARNEVAKLHQELRRQDGLNMVRASANRLSLITNHEPAKLARRFLWIAGFELTGFFCALGGLGWLQRG